MTEYRFTVIVRTDTAEHAEQVIEERLGYDEQYTDAAGVEFDYEVDRTAHRWRKPIKV